VSGTEFARRVAALCVWLSSVCAFAQSVPNIDALPRPVTPSPIDLEAIAKGYETMRPDLPRLATPALLVFVSFSMPEATLARLVDQAAKARATIVLRGFVNGSLKDTVVRAQRLIGERKVGFQIDPQAFDRFAVTRTPTFVLLRDEAGPHDCGAASCFARDAFVSTAGDVSIDYALELMQRASPRFAAQAAALLERLKR
jgi:conjugal transfer pilus assembly protein TrbC